MAYNRNHFKSEFPSASPAVRETYMPPGSSFPSSQGPVIQNGPHYKVLNGRLCNDSRSLVPKHQAGSSGGHIGQMQHFNQHNQASSHHRSEQQDLQQQQQQRTVGAYDSNFAGAGVSQINGVKISIVCEHEQFEGQVFAPTGTFYYKDCIKQGSGTQVNGLDVEYEGTTVPAHPGMNGRWSGNQMIPAADGSMDLARDQINGGRLRVKLRKK